MFFCMYVHTFGISCWFLCNLLLFTIYFRSVDDDSWPMIVKLLDWLLETKRGDKQPFRDSRFLIELMDPVTIRWSLSQSVCKSVNPNNSQSSSPSVSK